jgi:hypothetical protein
VLVWSSEQELPMVTSEVSALHRALDELGSVLGSLRERYGDVPAVRRLFGDLDRFELDAADLEGLVPVRSEAPVPSPHPASVTVIDDRPIDPALWADADDEGLGGYHR